MPKPAQCKIIGGISVVLGIGVLVASSVYLHESSYKKCEELFPFLTALVPNRFQRATDTGGQHGGNFPGTGSAQALTNDWHGDGTRHSNYDSQGYHASSSGVHAHLDQGSNYGQGPYGQGQYGQGQASPHNDGYGSDDGFFPKLGMCTGVIKKYRACAIIAIVASILQILISTVYAFANKNTVKTLSLGWVSTHLCILIAFIATSAVVLAEKRLDPQETGLGIYDSWKDDKDDLPEKKLGFAIMALLDAFFLILMIIFACLTFRKSDYNDYDASEPKPARKKFLES